MKTMKAICIQQIGQELGTMVIAVPEISALKVLVQIKIIGVGVHNCWFIPEDAEYPYVIGIEGARFICAIGSVVKEYEIGDWVMFTSSM